MPYMWWKDCYWKIKNKNLDSSNSSFFAIPCPLSEILSRFTVSCWTSTRAVSRRLFFCRTVNASIYILNDFNRIRKQKPLLSPVRTYLKAWNNKIVPIFLTIVSTILGFTPFMIGTQKEGFWFPLAAGTIGGLVMSVIGVFIFLPVLTLKKKWFTRSKAVL